MDAFVFRIYTCASCKYGDYYCIICGILIPHGILLGIHEIEYHGGKLKQSYLMSYTKYIDLSYDTLYINSIEELVVCALKLIKQLCLLSFNRKISCIGAGEMINIWTSGDKVGAVNMFISDILNNNFSCIMCGNEYDSFPSAEQLWKHIKVCFRKK